MLFGVGTLQEFHVIKEVLALFCVATGMQINMDKSNMLHYSLNDGVLTQLDVKLPFSQKYIDVGLTYLGFEFEMKPCSYLIENWMWILKKI
jgi:hypothetical protein